MKPRNFWWTKCSPASCVPEIAGFQVAGEYFVHQKLGIHSRNLYESCGKVIANQRESFCRPPFKTAVPWTYTKSKVLILGRAVHTNSGPMDVYEKPNFWVRRGSKINFLFINY